MLISAACCRESQQPLASFDAFLVHVHLVLLSLVVLEQLRGVLFQDLKLSQPSLGGIDCVLDCLALLLLSAHTSPWPSTTREHGRLFIAAPDPLLNRSRRNLRPVRDDAGIDVDVQNHVVAVMLTRHEVRNIAVALIVNRLAFVAYELGGESVRDLQVNPERLSVHGLWFRYLKFHCLPPQQRTASLQAAPRAYSYRSGAPARAVLSQPSDFRCGG